MLAAPLAPQNVAQASTASPGKSASVSPALLPSTEQHPILSMVKASPAALDSGDCDELENKRHDLVAAGKDVAACVTYGPTRRVRTDDMQAQAILPVPQWCLDSALDGNWYGFREEACTITGLKVSVRSLPNNAVIGEMSFNEYRFTYGSSTSVTVAQQIQLSMYDGWGQIAGTTVGGTAQCTGACTLVSSDFPIQPVTLSSRPGGEAYLRTTQTAAGTRSTMEGVFKHRFFNPSWNASGGATTELVSEFPTIRCDNSVPGYSVPGCIFPDWAGVYTYRLSGPYAELAEHIRDAQQSGLPGAFPGTGPNTAPLTRLVDPMLQNRNRAKACPTSWPRPEGRSCDEYPMASTQQGAAGRTATGRTFPWCSVSALPTGVTGPSGWSSCMIDEVQNSNGGSDMNVFLYQDQRILDFDKFYINIAP
ncbi:hypothetical protein JNW91_08490 [Micromonospora sp. STR1_7]|uniref:Deoxyribonuclease NucA/NucB domain-containing protein n=1 Tax=Micromonospora parastrephiae TaxID=2806101 RepID=A0ABS1XRK7_9ACTN|nr:hypothetical protein [Micromonospora parastrephiae]MBM0231890.1 hypothetical protein [Micromonospora parastrephiae]